MATHSLHRNTRRVRRNSTFGILIGSTAAAVALSLMPITATAAPAPGSDTTSTEPAAPSGEAAKSTTPQTADEAKRAWVKAAKDAAHLGEKVLVAEAAATQAQKKADAQAQRLAKADALMADHQVKVEAANKDVAGLQKRVDAFTNASFRGANLSPMAVLLTADSPEGYLDGAGSLDRVADDTRTMLDQARAARTVVEQAKADAAASRAEAARAKAAADTAAAAAESARKTLVADKAAMDKQVTLYQKAYAQLSVDERDSAVSEWESSNLSAAAKERHAQQRADRSAAGLSADGDADAAEFVFDPKTAPNTEAAIAVTAALSRVGYPYVWAAVGPDAFDCSGLMMWAWNQAGVGIPRVSSAQAGLRDVPLDELQPGDLVTYYSPVTHVGMYVGDGKVIHASMPGVPIKVVDLHAAGPSATGHAVNR